MVLSRLQALANSDTQQRHKRLACVSTSSFATDTFEPYVSPEVAAKYLGISRRELLARTRSGRFVGNAVDPNARRKDWRFKISELDAR